MGRIRSEKLSEHSCREKYERALSSKSVECEQNETEQIWLQVREALVNSAKEVCGCAKVGGRNVNSELWNDEVK